MSNIYADVLNVYKLYSELISASIAEGGPYASRTSLVKAMRTVKREVLRLIETFVERCEDPHLVAQQLVPPMMDPVLGDYARNVPDARDASDRRGHGRGNGAALHTPTGERRGR